MVSTSQYSCSCRKLQGQYTADGSQQHEIYECYRKTIHTDAPGFGSGILKYGKVTLDYMNKKFYLEPYQHISEINRQKKQWPVDSVIDNKKRVVGIIWDQDMTKRINTGGEMISFDGLDYQRNELLCPDHI